MTWTGRKFLAAISLAGAFALGGCAYDDGYYGGVSVGSGYYAGGYYDDYWGPGYYRPGHYGGWYNGYYYPGSGYYVYDRGGHRHRWNDGQRRYWERWREARQGGRNEGWRGPTQPSQGGRYSNRNGRWRESGANAVPANPPVARSQPGGTQRSWAPRARSDGDGQRSRRDDRRGWRR